MNMDMRQYEFIKRELTSKVIIKLIEKGWSKMDAITGFINSEVYDNLQDEETKVWHLSADHLLSLFQDETEGKLVWPDVV